jgi:hypothetical protein
VAEDANSEAVAAMAVMAAMAVTAATENSLVGLEQAMDAMEAIEAMATDSKALAVALAATRDVGRSSARASRAVMDTNNRVGVATSSRIMTASVVAIEAHISTP